MSETKFTTLKPTPEEAKEIRKTFNIVGLMLILFLIIMYFNDKPMGLICGLISGASGSVSDIIEAGKEFRRAHCVLNRVFEDFWCLMSTFIPMLIGCKLMGINIKDSLRRDTFTKDECKDAIIFGMGVDGLTTFTSMLIVMIVLIVSEGKSSIIAADATLSDKSSTAAAILRIIYILILGPICEELFCRGFVLQAFKKYGTEFAIFMSGLIFGLLHRDLFQLTYTVVFGIAMAMIAVSTKSIIPAIILHMISNFMVVLTGPMGDLFPQAKTIFLVLPVLIRIVFLFMLFGSFRKLYGKNGKWRISKDTPEEKSRSWKYMCTSLCLPMILVLVYLSLS